MLGLIKRNQMNFSWQLEGVLAASGHAMTTSGPIPFSGKVSGDTHYLRYLTFVGQDYAGAGDVAQSTTN